MGKAQVSRKRAAAEEYDSDDGFVEDAPKTKKSKKGAAKASGSQEMQKDTDGNEYWEISGKRRLQVSEFKGNTMIGIREFYEKDGQMLPGKKGISLNLDQFNAFVELLPQVEKVLKSKGIKVSRPDYGQKAAADPVDYDDDEEETAKTPDEDDEEEDEKPAVKAKSKLDKFKHKQNHEATSDEDDD